MSGSFEQLVLPHLDAAHNLARWMVRTRSDAEDVVQEAYLRAVTGFPGFRGGDAKAWLLRIVRNCALDSLAKRRGNNVVPIDTVMEASGSVRGALDSLVAEAPDADLERNADRALLHRLVSSLPIEFREVLILREVEELAYREIAVIVGIPVGTVMSRLARARILLKRRWEDEQRLEAGNGM
jgi:RNA polymerase sigma-70 factor (ECF subfamily)